MTDPLAPLPSLSFHEPGILRLRHFPPATAPRPSYAVVAPPGQVRVRTERRGQVEVQETEALRIELGPGTLRVLDRGGVALLEEGAGMGAWEEPGGRRVIRRPIAPGERFYGFGEKVGPLDKRGRSMVMWNTDAFDPALEGWRPDQDPLYQSIPLFVGLRGGVAYGLLVDDTRRLAFDMGASDPDAYRIVSEGG